METAVRFNFVLSLPSLRRPGQFHHTTGKRIGKRGDFFRRASVLSEADFCFGNRAPREKIPVILRKQQGIVSYIFAASAGICLSVNWAFLKDASWSLTPAILV